MAAAGEPDTGTQAVRAEHAAKEAAARVAYMVEHGAEPEGALLQPESDTPPIPLVALLTIMMLYQDGDAMVGTMTSTTGEVTPDTRLMVDEAICFMYGWDGQLGNNWGNPPNFRGGGYKSFTNVVWESSRRPVTPQPDVCAFREMAEYLHEVRCACKKTWRDKKCDMKAEQACQCAGALNVSNVASLAAAADTFEMPQTMLPYRYVWKDMHHANRNPLDMIVIATVQMLYEYVASMVNGRPVPPLNCCSVWLDGMCFGAPVLVVRPAPGVLAKDIAPLLKGRCLEVRCIQTGRPVGFAGADIEGQAGWAALSNALKPAAWLRGMTSDHVTAATHDIAPEEVALVLPDTLDALCPQPWHLLQLRHCLRDSVLQKLQERGLITGEPRVVYSRVAKRRSDRAYAARLTLEPVPRDFVHAVPTQVHASAERLGTHLVAQSLGSGDVIAVAPWHKTGTVQVSFSGMVLQEETGEAAPRGTAPGVAWIAPGVPRGMGLWEAFAAVATGDLPPWRGTERRPARWTFTPPTGSRTEQADTWVLAWRWGVLRRSLGDAKVYGTCKL